MGKPKEQTTIKSWIANANYSKLYNQNNKTMGRPKGQITVESWIIANGKSGQHFYSDKTDGHLTAIAKHHQRKISTERLITIKTGGKEPKANNITKVTLL